MTGVQTCALPIYLVEADLLDALPMFLGGDGSRDASIDECSQAFAQALSQAFAQGLLAVVSAR